jgi:hypothetical protein
MQITVAVLPECDFLDCLNSIHKSIQCNMEMERDSHLPFLNIDIYRRPGRSGAIRYAVNLPTLTSISAPVLTITHPTNMLYFPHCCT